MDENTNKTLAVNTLILYVRLFIVAICGLVATRFALQALGIVDFGLFSVLGSVVSFTTLINTIMLTTTNRFIATAIGKGNIQDANIQFNVSLVVHVAIAIIVLLIALPLGLLYVKNYINYDGNITDALIVYSISIIGAVFSFIGVPYNGLILAKEKFLVFCMTDVISQLIKVVVTYLLLYNFTHKLYIYAGTVAFTAAYPTIIYFLYCKRISPEIVKAVLVKKWSLYKEVLAFSGWVGYGAIACIGKSQGAALIVNAFFNTVMNTALGIANSLSGYINMIAENVARPIAPQVTKCFAQGNMIRCNQLLIMSTKYTFLVMLFVASPFLVDCQWILTLWLGQVPPYAEMFTKLLIVDALVVSLNSGISNLIFATGNIRNYQIGINTLRIASIIAAYFVLRAGFPAYYLLYTYIALSCIIVIIGQWILHVQLKYDNMILIRKSYIPSLIILCLFIPSIFVTHEIHPIFRILLSCVYLSILILFIGINGRERNFLKDFVLNKIK